MADAEFTPGSTLQSEGERSRLVAEDSEAPEEVTIILCVLNQEGTRLNGRRIWRRLAVPSELSLLELHVALQNAFDWDNVHLHQFRQPKVPPPSLVVPPLSAFGRTDFSGHTFVDIEDYEESQVRLFQKPATDMEEDVGIAEGSSGSKGEEEEAAIPLPVFLEDNGDSQAPVLDERAFLVGQLLLPSSPLLVYEYDFGIGLEVQLLFQGAFPPTEGISYPTCLAGSGASVAEDGNDLAEEGGGGELGESYDYEDFAVSNILDNFEEAYADSWPLGPGEVEDTSELKRCYMCRFNRECVRRRECSGSCCTYCLKSEIAVAAGSWNLQVADEACKKIAAAS